jgi:hypothetical protein
MGFDLVTEQVSLAWLRPMLPMLPLKEPTAARHTKRLIALCDCLGSRALSRAIEAA